MSRHPNQNITTQDQIAEAYVRFISSNAIPKATTIEEIDSATSTDPTLQKVIELHQNDKWDTIASISYPEINKEELKIFSTIKQSLTINGNFLLKNSQIVIPQTLLRKAIELAHVGHMGITKTKMLIREQIWFSFIDKFTKEQIEYCLPCQATSHACIKKPMASNTLLPCPWHTLKTDFKGPLPSGEYLLDVYDCYLHFPEVDLVKPTSAVIPTFDEIFSTHGIPETLISDNGPPFQSEEWAKYMNTWGKQHKHDTPSWPQGNAEAESFMRTLKKLLRTCQMENTNIRKELFQF